MEKPCADNGEELARRACLGCKQRKRKCDKAIPRCMACVKDRRNCEYPKQNQDHVPTAHAGDSPAATHTPVPSDVVFRPDVMIHCGSSTFPPVYFLDKDMFQRSLVEIPRMDFQVSSDILNLNGSTDNVREVASMYFRLVHPWMPFISRKLFYDQLLSPLMPLRAESSLLFACMQLAISLPHSSNPRTSAYLTVKVELFRAEIAGVLTLRLLQAWVLVSLYEIGHAIYPSAYMSIGTCARYADALSITASRESCPDTPRNWVGTEERRRTWWAVRILDCYANLGIYSWSVATKDPKQDDMLPMDDTAWDQGVSEPRSTFTLSSPPSPRMGRFSLLAQAANLLGQVLRHVCDHGADTEFHAREAAILDRTLIALTSVSREESRMRGTDLCGATIICHSARLVLNCTTVTPSNRNDRVAATVKSDVAEDMLKMSRWALSGSFFNTVAISPLLLHCMYHTAATFAQLYSQAGGQAYLEASQDIKKAMRLLAGRWAAAEEYLKVLEARDASYMP